MEECAARLGLTVKEIESILALAARIACDRTDAEDVRQEAIKDALLRFGMEQPSDPRRWFLQRVRNAAKKMSRIRQKVAAVDPEVLAGVADGRTPSGPSSRLLDFALPQWVDDEKFDRCCGLLSKQEQEILTRAARGQSYAEIGAAIGITEANARQKAKRARDSVFDCVEKGSAA